MKFNEKTMIVGENVLLLPYERHHVPKYHQWMKSKELQQLTASEPLSLEEEFNMQRSWREDENKCTFIVVKKSSYEASQMTGMHKQEKIEIDSMVGDVNLFFLEDRDIAEVEIMIADENARGQGLGKQALCSMMRYGMEMLGIRKYVAKIKLKNLPSIHLFTSLGFSETSRSEVFQETTLEKDVSQDFMKSIQFITPAYEMQTYCS